MIFLGFVGLGSLGFEFEEIETEIQIVADDLPCRRVGLSY